MAFSLLNILRWIGKRKAKPARRHLQGKAKSIRLRLEPLEQRCVPTTINYTTAGSSYTQNFSTLPDAGGTATITTGTGSPVQGPYDLSSSTGGAFGASGLSGWSALNIATTVAAEKFAAGKPSTTTGALFDFNDGTAGSQALGTISTSSVTSRFGAIFTNNTSATLTQFTLSYTGEEWWANSGTGTSLTFSYQLGIASLPTTTTAGTMVSQLGFTGPTTGAGVSVDAFTTSADQVSVNNTVTGISWTSGQTLAIYWDKGAGASTSDGLGIANVSFTAAATPTVTSSTDNLPKNATSMTITGSGFDPNLANDSVQFSNSVTGTVTSVNASGTSMTVTSLSGLSSVTAGTMLDASVTVDGAGSGSTVAVATVAAASTPTVTSSTDSLPNNAATMTIIGTGFDATITANDMVTFNSGVTGSVTGATATNLTVGNFSGLGSLSAGTVLKASVTVDGVSSGAAVSVATVAASSTPTVTSSTANLVDNATSLTINGTGFDGTITANDVVTFDNGVTGTVTSASAISLIVGNLSGLNVLTAGTVLNASVAVDGVSSGAAVPVATVAPVTISYSTAGSSYTQNFSTLPDAGGTATIVTNSAGIGPYDLIAASPIGYGAAGLTGWYSANIASAATSEKLGQGEPSTTTGALFDFNDGTVGSQSLGTISTSSTSSRFGAIFTNTTAGTLNQFTLSYTGEEWWANSGTGTSLSFSYETGVSSLPTGTTGYTTVSQLSFTGPTTGAGAYVDAFTTTADQVSVSFTATGFNWTSGQTLAIFWDKGAGAGTSDGLGVANVNFSATFVAAGPSITSAPNVTAYAGVTPSSFQLTTTSSGSPTFSVSPALPSWASLNVNTGLISFTTPPAVSTTTTTSFTLTATDANGTGSPQTFTLTELPTIAYATVGSSTTQNFSALPTTAQVATVSTGSPGQGPYDLTGTFPNGFGAGDGLAGWYSENIASGASTNKMAVGPASATTGALFAFDDGTPANGEALGAISTTSVASSFGAILVNNTSATLTAFTLSYTGEEWYQGATVDTTPLSFFYQVGGTGFTGTTASPGSATNVPSLGFTPPNSGTSGTEDGTLPANQVSVNGTVSGLTWGPGQTLVIYWNKGTGVSGGNGLGVSNVSFSAGTPPAITSTNNVTFVGGTGGNFTVTDTGSPSPTLAETVTLPSGVTFTPSTGVLAVGTTAANGVYNLTFTANNGVGSQASQSFTLTISMPITTTSITDNGPNPSTAGQFVNFTVVVTGGVPNGELFNLEDAGNGNAIVATGAFTNGTDTVPVSNLSGGTHNLFAVYAGDSNLSGSQSSAVPQTVNPGPATHLVFTSQPINTIAGLASGTITITLEDRYGNVATASGTQTVFLTTTSSGGSFTPATFVTIATGASTATITYIDTQTGTPTITATDSALTTQTVTQQEIVNAAAAYQLALTPSVQTLTAGTPSSTITVTLEDQFGNVATASGTQTINLTTNSSGGSFTSTPLSIPTGHTTTTFTYTDTKAGTPTITATDTALTTQTVTQQETVNATTPAQLVFATSVQTLTAGVTSGTITVQLEDPFNNVATATSTQTIALSTTSSAGQFRDNATGNTQITSVTIASGASSASFKYNDTLSGSPVLTAADSPLTAATLTETVNAATASKVAFAVQPGNTAGGFAINPAVQAAVQDQFGNVLTTDQTDQVTLTVASGPGSFTAGSTTTVTVHNGVATFSNLILNTAGTYKLAESATGSLTGANSSAFNVTLAVTSFTATPTGFTATFSQPFNNTNSGNTAQINLYNSSSSNDGAADVTLVSNTTGKAVTGSLVISSNNQTVTFIKTTEAGTNGLPLSNDWGLLPADTYTATLVSGSQAFETAAGLLLDGLSDGTSGSGNYTTTFTVSPLAANTEVVTVPDFARGPDTTDLINVPNNSSPAVGIPIDLTLLASTQTVAFGSGVTGGTFRLTFNGSSTGAITWSSTPATLATNIKNALGALANVGSTGNVTVTGTGPFTVTFAATVANPGLMTVSVNSLTPSGSTITITDPNAPANVTSATFTLDYNASLLTISGGTVNSSLSGATFTVTTSGAGSAAQATITFHSTAGVNLGTLGSVLLGGLTATVPTNAQYKSLDLLHFDLTSGANNTIDGGTVPVVTSDGLHVVAFPGDATGLGGSAYTSADSVDIVRVAGKADSGFGAFPIVDPVIIGDLSDNGLMDSGDATILNSIFTGGSPAQLPPYAGPASNNPSGPDPTVSIPTDLSAGLGGIVMVPVNIDDPVPAANAGMTEATLALKYDPSVLSVSAADVSLGTVPASGTGWTLQVAVNQATGELGITLFSSTPITDPAGGSLVTINFHVNGTAVPGATAINLVSAVNPSGFNVISTMVADTQGAFTLSSGPTGGATSANGIVTILAPTPVSVSVAETAPAELAAVPPSESVSAVEVVEALLPPTPPVVPVAADGRAEEALTSPAPMFPVAVSNVSATVLMTGVSPALQPVNLAPAVEENVPADGDGIANPLSSASAPMTDGQPLTAVVDTPAANPLTVESAPTPSAQPPVVVVVDAPAATPPAATNDHASGTTATDQGDDSAFAMTIPTFAALRSKNRGARSASPANVFALDAYFARVAEEMKQRDAK